MIDPQVVPWLIGLAAVLIAAWWAFGAWEYGHRNPRSGRKRYQLYHWANEAQRLFRQRRRERKGQAQPPTSLAVDDMSLSMAMDYDARARRRKRNG